MGDLKLHEPVLKEEVASFIRGEGVLVDCTVGTGGHAEYFLRKFPGLRVIGIDKDPEALKVAQQRLQTFGDRVKLIHADYRRLPELELDWNQIEEVFFDLGLSSWQLSSPGRGFSYLREEIADMRFNPNEGEPAYVWLRKASFSELVRAFLDYADLRGAQRLAQSIIALRPGIKTTTDIVKAVEKAYGKAPPALLSRVFQAIRIAVNRELEGLEELLKEIIRIARRGTRLMLITFHSVEDRIVKRTMKEADAQGSVKLLTKKPILPSPAEVVVNPRSRSAKLRVCEVL